MLCVNGKSFWYFVLKLATSIIHAQEWLYQRKINTIILFIAFNKIKYASIIVLS